MTQTEFQLALQAQQSRKSRSVLHKNTALALIAALAINPEGREFVCICGKGDERSNADAVQHWVSQQATDNYELSSFKQLKQLLIRLLTDATDITEAL
jgi:hypothetical protein